MNYKEFLSSKVDIAPETGFDIEDSDINPVVKPHQRDSIRWALKGGRRGIFAKFGLGKTVMELEYGRIVTERVGGRALIILPLGVKQEFTRDAVKLLGWDAPPPYVRTMAEVLTCEDKIVMTNYERVRDGDIDPRTFTAVILDEASVLRSYGSKTYQEFTEKMRGVPYKLVCTATPSPNRYKELIHYAGYLEVMDTGQALTRFFQRDSSKAGNLTLYPLREQEFWLWVSSWALFLTKPSDLGYSDEGYALPEITINWHTVASDHAAAGADRDGQMRLVRNTASGLLDAMREKRETIDSRVAYAKGIVDAAPEDHFILWHDLEDERHAIKRAMPEAVEIYGSQDIELREARTIAFSEGEFRLLATKKELSGSGCNFQRHCHRAVFVGIDYEFNDFIQAIHRIYRFLQDQPVTIDIIATESEQPIVDALRRKWAQHEHMVEQMVAIIHKYGLSGRAAISPAARRIPKIWYLEQR